MQTRGSQDAVSVVKGCILAGGMPCIFICLLHMIFVFNNNHRASRNVPFLVKYPLVKGCVRTPFEGLILP